MYQLVGLLESQRANRRWGLFGHASDDATRAASRNRQIGIKRRSSVNPLPVNGYCYSLLETAKAYQLEPSAYITYVLERIGEADTLKKLEALLPWNVPLEPISKKWRSTAKANRSI